MKLTKETLKRIIKEELDKVMNEEELSEGGYTPKQTAGDPFGQLKEKADPSKGAILESDGEDDEGNKGMAAKLAGLNGQQIKWIVDTLAGRNGAFSSQNLKNEATNLFDAFKFAGEASPYESSYGLLAHLFFTMGSGDRKNASLYKRNLDSLARNIWAPLETTVQTDATEKKKAEANPLGF